jgi:uncharacterized protein YjbI with pentapeptide repeats
MDRDRPPTDFGEWIGLREMPEWSRARTLGSLVGVLIGLILILALAAAIRLLVGVFHPDASATGNLGVGALIVAILGAPFVIWNTVIKHRALGFQKEGHITDRINKAVEQLGAEKTVKRRETGEDGKPVTVEETVPNIEVRIGALLSLERIAQDSTSYDNGRDHVRVMEILCAYVRENAPARTAKDHPFGEWEPLKDGATEEERKAHLAKRKERFGDRLQDGKVRNWARSLPPPREDIALALRIVGRRTPEQRGIEARHGAASGSNLDQAFGHAYPKRPDLPATEPGASAQLSIFKANLRQQQERMRSYCGYRLDLRETNLQRAELSKADFSAGIFSGARLEGASFRGATADGAIFQFARLDGAEMTVSNLMAADFPGARLEGADLGSARMQGVNMENARLDGVDMLCTGLEYADLSAASLQAANLLLSNLEGACLSGANLDYANVSAEMDGTTSLEGVSLHAAFAQHQDWSSVRLSILQVSAMFGDGSMTLPGAIKPTDDGWPAHWPRWFMPMSSQKVADSYRGPIFYDEYQRWLADPAAYVPPPPPDPAPPS